MPIDVRITVRICLKYSFHLHLHLSNSCVRVPKHVYAFPPLPYSYHLLPYPIVCFVSCSLLVTIFLFFFFFFFYIFNRHVCHGAYWCTHNPAHMPRLLPIYIFISHLPSTSRTLRRASKYTSFQYILLPLLFEPLFPLCFLLRVNTCWCLSKHVYAFPSSSIFIHT